MKFLDIFAGIGGFRLGLEMAGHECVGHIEWDKFAQESYNAMHEIKEDEYCGWDIQEVRARELPRADIWTFGFPCQDISSASYAHTDATGLAGTRSGLFWEMAKTFRLVGKIIGRKPTVLLENVAALFRQDRQSDMGLILGTLASEWGHTEWDCVGAGTVGAPHHRARAYIFADDRSLGRSRFFPNEILRQPEYDCWKDVRCPTAVPERSSLYPSKLCRGNDGARKRLHAIGNGNPPCVIRELTRGIE